jgi:hypothetical protein
MQIYPQRSGGDAGILQEVTFCIGQSEANRSDRHVVRGAAE